MVFPGDFIWGAATASYQVEGAAFEDGKGASVWDMMCRKENAIWNNQTGDVACDHYHRYVEDVALMQHIGLKAYRFSISWPRVLPDGVGAVNQKGLAFYDRLVDALLAAGITPFITLFHWDYPYALYCRGGWLNADSPQWFADYAAVAVDRLSDRVQHWIPQNEPQCFIGLGHLDGTHAPGDRLALAEVLRAAHHSLLAHGRAVQTIRARAKSKPQVGCAPVGVVSMPATDSPADIAAAMKAMESIAARHLWNNTWWSDPIFLGRYPHDGLKLFGSAAPKVGPGDMQIIHQPPDFFGVNIYHGACVKAGPDGNPVTVPQPDGHALTAFRWPVTPEALYWGPKFLFERYGRPVIITENGMAGLDWPALDGQVHDPQRIDYTARYLRELRRAIADGVDVRGYFHWSLMDNFEWAEGYRQRFGLVHVDYATQARTPKDSARWYARVIATNGGDL